MSGFWLYLYLAAALLFVFGIKRLTNLRKCKSGSRIAAFGMLLAVIATLVITGNLNWWVLIAGLIVGAAIGQLLAAKVPTTSMPELVAAFNGLGGGASTFVAMATLVMVFGDVSLADLVAANSAMGSPNPQLTTLFLITVPLTVLIGTATFTGSLVAYFKLSGKKMVHPVSGMARHYVHGGLVLLIIAFSFWLVLTGSTAGVAFASILLVAASGLLGWLIVLPIGGADMPVVVALLNSYSGLAAAFSGFIILNPVLIVAGALVGTSGLILTKIMCKAMNRSLANVLLGGIGDDSVAEDAREYANIKSTSAEEVAMLFEAASSVIMVPGYGLAVAQAQHTIRELGDLLAKRDVTVRYAIHPVAGRMPGHMNVLLAESDVPYDQLWEMERINSDFSNTDVVVVVGANDVVNPIARTDPKSPIAGMPILDVDYARTVVVIKRSLSPGYAGIRNPLFDNDNTLMFFSDAKQALEGMVKEVKELD